MIDEESAERVLEIFEDADISIIKAIIYFDGWCSYEESGGYLIFRGIDDSIQKVDYGYSVMSSDNSNLFNPVEISEKDAADYISRMNSAIKEGY